MTIKKYNGQYGNFKVEAEQISDTDLYRCFKIDEKGFVFICNEENLE